MSDEEIIEMLFNRDEHAYIFLNRSMAVIVARLRRIFCSMNRMSRNVSMIRGSASGTQFPLKDLSIFWLM